MSWRTVIVTNRCKLDLKMGYMVIRGEDAKRIFLDEIAEMNKSKLRSRYPYGFETEKSLHRQSKDI